MERQVAAIATTAQVAHRVDNWEDAVRGASRLLEDLRVASADYTDACVQSVKDNGPYIVLSPGIAIAHARPEQGAQGLGITVLLLREAVRFGHETNDPVDVVFALATPDSDAHVGALGVLAKALRDGLANQLRDSLTAAEVATVLSRAVENDI
ncbi:PTS sugar transporter subunit IIA [Demequina sediminicola]|uniref:PTS sugar transporter subunit IIA n=1 Tax=Demequina sediminicola TaxID=1095026 RepID=UPI0009E319F5|nr:PTS sugar transporter subunit IIA [Demequina sediminicola]